MKKIITVILILFSFINLNAQSPVALFPDINIQKVMTVKNYVSRICYSKVDNSFYYLTLSGDIYKIKKQSAVYSDTLLYTSVDHTIQACQGMVILDSTIFVSGNNDKDSVLTKGFLMKGVLNASNIRVWSQVARTVPYFTSKASDHWISGLGINKTNDTLLVCSGSRGDHGEINDRGGLAPLARNLALTSVIFQIPITTTGLIIPNDSVALDAQNLVFARGIRNTYDFAYNASGDLFGADNSGDRDMEDELNWLQKGHHYGFPWIMGGSENPQQFPWYDPFSDSLINHNSNEWIQGRFTNDPTFPQKPIGLITDLPCLNNGVDAAYMRDSITGITYNAGVLGQGIYSFTPHRSPLGLVFDTDSILGGMYNGNGFVLSYTRGDSSIAGYSKLLSPFKDPSEDLIMMKMIKDNFNQTYSFSSTKIVSNFSTPIDAVLLDTSIYVIEIGGGNTSSLWRIDFPKTNTSIVEQRNPPFEIYPNPCNDYLKIHFKDVLKERTTISIQDVTGKIVLDFNSISGIKSITLPVSKIKAGIYMLEIVNNKNRFVQKFIKE